MIASDILDNKCKVSAGYQYVARVLFCGRRE